MTRFSGLTVVFTLLASFAIATPTQQDEDASSSISSREAAAKKACVINVPGVGRFKQHVQYNFAKWTTFPPDLAISDYGITADPNDDEHPFDQFYNTTNVILKRGRPLQLRVPGGQTRGPIQGAEITTAYDDILYASVRTVAKVSKVAGTCHGFFFYKNDNQEIDMEIRTAHPKTIFLTNQKASSRATPSTFQTSPHYDMTSDFHEYRFDWLPGVSKFYIDGAFVGSMKKNVPSVAGSVVWNNWANGGSWSGGPPVSDSFLEIKSVEMYFNRTSVRGVAC